jgi:DNA-binding response OmpR family regulator
VTDSKTLKLLLVEDSPEDEQLLSEALIEIEETRQWCNWRSSSVVPIDRLADALDCLRGQPFDAILLNLSLPDSPALLDSFLEVNGSAQGAPILVLADEPDENLANRLLREGAQDVLVKAEIECPSLARAVRYAIERQRRANGIRASAFIDPLTGVLTRDAFLSAAAHRDRIELLALVEISADRDALDPLLIQTAEALRRDFQPPAILGRWDRSRLCVLAAEAALQRAAVQLASGILRFSIATLEQTLNGDLRLHSKTAILAD